MKTRYRKSGSEILGARFPTAKMLWSVTHDGGFTISGWNINGRSVLLHEFGWTRGNSWDVFVQASQSGEVNKTLEDLEAFVKGERDR